MAEAIFLIIVVGFVLLISIPWLMHVSKFYAVRAVLVFFKFEKATISLSPQQTKNAYQAMEIINKRKEKQHG